MKAMKLYPADTAALATEDLKKGDTVVVDGEEITLLDDIPSAHKIALKDFDSGEPIKKYDNTIGYASKPIKKGEWIHSHNERTGLGKSKNYTYHFHDEAIFPGKSDHTFMGYDRADGSAGIRNYMALISTVFCANGPLQKLAKMADQKYPVNESFDGIFPLTQEFGCSQAGKDLETTCRILAGMIKNANFGGVLIVSLGCEMAIPSVLKKYLGDYDESRIKVLSLQNCDDEFEAGMALIDEIMTAVKGDRRTPIAMNRLHIAMNCGGSDGYSGITANTLLGTLCDTLVKEGACMNMTEVPEMMGAEHILMNRAADESIFQDIVSMIHAYEDYCDFYGEKPAENPTQGNKAGGLTTLEEKSLGCIQKGGHCAVMEVLKYGERASKNGFILISGPGNDLAGVTGQIAAGAVLTIFTTGRGTPCGFAGPTFRLSSNTALAKKKAGWIDYDAGRLLGADSAEVSQLNKELCDAVMATVNGDYRTRNEVNGYYQMGIMKDGVTL
ncbi:altronate dehydratase family protein [Emergencia timonensis]|uniref:UxaA family hydrolase n=1 Tax=Emergencia timonensis TaxID=1776384 RepID=UPI00082ECABD|nr:altronate dehydratase family protein [Emergencia timonensis]WNX87300.1 altronate dehydratase family protein [Emergencia timonensis]